MLWLDACLALSKTRLPSQPVSRPHSILRLAAFAGNTFESWQRCHAVFPSPHLLALGTFTFAIVRRINGLAYLSIPHESVLPHVMFLTGLLLKFVIPVVVAGGPFRLKPLIPGQVLVLACLAMVPETSWMARASEVSPL